MKAPKFYYPKFLPIPKRFAAITLPPAGIFIRNKYRQNVPKEQFDRLVRHECAHWHQAYTFGILRFYWLYLWWSMRYGYYSNPFEVEARKVAHGVNMKYPEEWADG